MAKRETWWAVVGLKTREPIEFFKYQVFADSSVQKWEEVGIPCRVVPCDPPVLRKKKVGKNEYQ